MIILPHCTRITEMIIICLSTNRWRRCANLNSSIAGAQSRSTLRARLQICHFFFSQVFEGERSLRSRLMLPGSVFRLCLNQFTHQPLRLWARQRRSRAPCQSLAAFHTLDRRLVTVHRRKGGHFIVKRFPIQPHLLLSFQT